MRPVIILGIHKSGTSLVRSLLDGAPGLAVLPRETHFFERLGFGVAYPLRPAAPAPSTEADFLRRVSSALEEEPSDTNQFSDSAGFPGYDLRRFLDSWPNGVGSTGDLYRRYIETLWLSASGTDVGSRRIVDKCVTYLEYGELLMNLFPGANLVQVVRNPYATLVAYRRYRVQFDGVYPDLRRIGQALAYSYYWMSRLRRVVSSFTVIRYEELVSEPARVMQAVAGSIDVPYVESMLHPTLLAAPWSGNSTSGAAFAGISQERLEAWRREIAPAEAYSVNRALPETFWDEMGYEPLQVTRRRALRPTRGEHLRAYLAARV
jgi:hypothetical protein